MKDSIFWTVLILKNWKVYLNMKRCKVVRKLHNNEHRFFTIIFLHQAQRLEIVLNKDGKFFKESWKAEHSNLKP